ncbi:MAG: Ger(x)C family spore germination protein [Neobacillus sp.]|jgi:spore germination protein
MGKLLTILLCVLLTAGCAQKKIIDDLALINAVGYDKTNNKEEPLKVTVTFPMISKDGQYDRKTITVYGKSSKEAKGKVRYQTNLLLESGQLRVALFGSELAKEGLVPYVDTIVRDPSIGSRVMLALGKNEANDILTLQINNEGQNATYLEQFITKLNIESRAVHYNIHQFLRDYYDDGIDPVMPVFKVEKKNIAFDGVGLFQGDKLKKILNTSDTNILFLLRKKVKHGNIGLEIETKEEKKAHIMLSYVQTTHRIKVKMEKDKPVVTIYLKVVGDILEYMGKDDLTDPKIKKEAENSISDELNKQGEEMIKQLQGLQVDPLGVGGYVRNKMNYKEWKEIDWYDLYKDMNIGLKMEVKINSSGKWK